MNESKGRLYRDFELLFGGLRRTTSSRRSHDIDAISTKPPDREGEPRWKDYNEIDPKERETLTEHQLFLLPQHMLGFTLGNKKWSKFNCLFLADCVANLSQESWTSIRLKTFQSTKIPRKSWHRFFYQSMKGMLRSCVRY